MRVLPRGLERPDLVCTGCGSYVHRFLERCPMCGIERGRPLDDAIGAWDALGALNPPDLPAPSRPASGSRDTDLAGHSSLDQARQRAAETFEAAQAHIQLAQLTLRYEGGLSGLAGGRDVRLACTGGQIQLVDARTGQTLAAISPADILAAMPSSDRRPSLESWAAVIVPRSIPVTPPVWGYAFSIAFAAGGQACQFGLSNRPGFFATKARPDYFRVLAGELAAVGDAAVDVAVLEGGPLAYARRLGMLPADWHEADRTPGEAASPRSATSATLAELLAQLSEALERGLLSRAEFEAKRREILDRF